MADIRLEQGKAWLGVSGFGVQLDVYYQTPGYGRTYLTSTPANNTGNGTFGNGIYVSAPPYMYIGTTGIGAYKLWAERPGDSSVRSNEATYYFDPDNYEGGGDPFDWNGYGIVDDLIFPAKWFTIQGIHRRTMPESDEPVYDWDHIVVSPSSTCEAECANYQHYVTVPAHSTSGESAFSGLKFAFPGSPGNTFYAYIRDHNCSAVSNVHTITGVSGSGGSYDVGTLSLYVPA